MVFVYMTYTLHILCIYFFWKLYEKKKKKQGKKKKQTLASRNKFDKKFANFEKNILLTRQTKINYNNHEQNIKKNYSFKKCFMDYQTMYCQSKTIKLYRIWNSDNCTFLFLNVLIACIFILLCFSVFPLGS